MQLSRGDFDLSSVQLNRKYPVDVICINPEKLKDLELLMPYMEDFGKQWVREALEAQRAERGQGSMRPIVQEELVDDPDNQAMDYEEIRCISELP